MDYTIQQAQERLAELIEQALSGADVVITTGEQGTRIARLVPVPARRPIRIGWLKGQIPDVGLDSPFFDPLPEDELRLWDGEGE